MDLRINNNIKLTEYINLCDNKDILFDISIFTGIIQEYVKNKKFAELLSEFKYNYKFLDKYKLWIFCCANIDDVSSYSNLSSIYNYMKNDFLFLNKKDISESEKIYLRTYTYLYLNYLEDFKYTFEDKNYIIDKENSNFYKIKELYDYCFSNIDFNNLDSIENKILSQNTFLNLPCDLKYKEKLLNIENSNKEKQSQIHALLSNLCQKVYFENKNDNSTISVTIKDLIESDKSKLEKFLTNLDDIINKNITPELKILENLQFSLLDYWKDRNNLGNIKNYLFNNIKNYLCKINLSMDNFEYLLKYLVSSNLPNIYNLTNSFHFRYENSGSRLKELTDIINKEIYLKNLLNEDIKPDLIILLLNYVRYIILLLKFKKELNYNIELNDFDYLSCAVIYRFFSKLDIFVSSMSVNGIISFLYLLDKSNTKHVSNELKYDTLTRWINLGYKKEPLLLDGLNAFQDIPEDKIIDFILETFKIKVSKSIDTCNLTNEDLNKIIVKELINFPYIAQNILSKLKIPNALLEEIINDPDNFIKLGKYLKKNNKISIKYRRFFSMMEK